MIFCLAICMREILGGVNEGGIPRKWGIRACCTQASPLIAAHCTLLTSQLTQYRLESTCAATVCQLSGSHTRLVWTLSPVLLYSWQPPLCFAQWVMVWYLIRICWWCQILTSVSLKNRAPGVLHLTSLTAPLLWSVTMGSLIIMISLKMLTFVSNWRYWQNSNTLLE